MSVNTFTFKIVAFNVKEVFITSKTVIKKNYLFKIFAYTKICFMSSTYYINCNFSFFLSLLSLLVLSLSCQPIFLL